MNKKKLIGEPVFGVFILFIVIILIVVIVNTHYNNALCYDRYNELFNLTSNYIDTIGMGDGWRQYLYGHANYIIK